MYRMKNIFVFVLMAATFLFAATANSNPQVNQSKHNENQQHINGAVSPNQYFYNMVQAVKKINYRGILVFNSIAPGDGTISALEIVHRNQEQKEVKISSIDGRPVSIYRKNNKIKEVLGGKHQVQRIINNPFENFCANTLNQEQLSQNYAIDFKKDSVTAGRDVKVIMLTPKNQQVYGYSFYIDKENYMPLKMDYIHNNGTSINSYMFVDIEYPEQLAQKDMEIDQKGKVVMPEDISEMEVKTKSENPDVLELPSEKHEPNWSVDYLPEGFSLFDHGTTKFNEKHDKVEHFVFSDGIALISVYIEKVPEHQIFRGSSIKGAMSAFGTVKDGYQVVVVGKVPVVTLEKVGNSVQKKTQENVQKEVHEINKEKR